MNRALSALVTYDLNWAELTSVTSYQNIRTNLVQDISRGYIPIFAPLGLVYGAIGAANADRTERFTQELRLAGGGRPVEWLIGAYYNNESSHFNQEFVLRDTAGNPAPNILFSASVPSSFEEYALFGNLTWHLSDRFDLSGGIRVSRNRQEIEQRGSGLLIGSRPPTRSSEDVVTYLANARYRITDRAMVYARYATGYRPGGPNYQVLDPVTGLPVGASAFDSDTLQSAELGVRFETADRSFAFDLSAYHINWQDIQISVIRGGLGAIDNAQGGATINGLELALTARPARNFTITGAFAYQDATMSDTDPEIGSRKGERLPNVPEFTATLSADYELSARGLRPTIGATLRFVDDRSASFDASLNSPQFDIPSYTTVDLRSSLTLDPVTLQLFVRNLFNNRALYSAQTWRLFPVAAVAQPRTIGITATSRF